MCDSIDEKQFLSYQVERKREGNKRDPEGGMFIWGGVRQSHSQARASWPVEAVNRQGSLVFCA